MARQYDFRFASGRVVSVTLVGLAAIFCLPEAGRAQPGRQHDPNWPCQQIKVSELSLAAVWSGPPVDPGGAGWQEDQEIVELVNQVAPRRETVEHAQSLIHDFARRAGDQKRSRLVTLLAGLYSVANEDRDSVIAGLDRFGARQKELAAELRGDNTKLHALQGGAEPATGAVQQMTAQVTWEAKVFEDRQRALSYACEVPGKIEQRLFALAHQIEQELD